MSEPAAGPERVAVILFSLGGPDSLRAVRPFLFNLFSDPAILRVPNPVRWLLAMLIAWRRAPVARRIYRQIGGASPLLANSRDQSHALEQALNETGGIRFRCFLAMRYWHPRSTATVAEVRDFRPDRLVLLPLYPQYSTTTSASSLAEWRRVAARAGLRAPAVTVCCYPELPGFADSVAAMICRAGLPDGARLLFSAHGLPERVIEAGDPYQWQVEASCAATVRRLGIDGLDWRICYQSRVGPLTWIGPSTEEEIRRAGRERKPVMLVPIAFVSEHSETLVELDIEYRELALASGVPEFRRVPAVGIAPGFIAGLAGLVRDALAGVGEGEAIHPGGRICPADRSGCPCPAAPR